MNKIWLGLVCCIYQCCWGAPIELTVNAEAVLEETDRIGINLGTWTTWGAEQLSKNILMNPGFEGYVDRVIVIVTQADENNFFDEPDWGYDDNYWKDAIFEVRTGTSTGASGKIARSLRKGSNGLPHYQSEKPLPKLSPKDIITLTKLSSDDPVPLWWLSESAKERVHVDTTERRPLSSGTQSLSMQPKADTSTEIDYYLDAITERAGKLLAVNGKWRFSLWIRSESVENSVHVVFRRINGTPPFFEQVIPLSSDWKEYTFDFEAVDNGPPQTLQIKLAAVGNAGKVWIDDIFLGPVQLDNLTSFRQEVVDVLLKIKPSYIRDTQGQLGDTFQNRMADIYARRAISSRAFAGTRNLSTGYSIPDLLDLCLVAKANPWIVIPPTFTDKEALLLGQYLAQHANKTIFNTVAVEFGNENWNWLFRATGIPYAHEHGLVADKLFQQIQQGAGSNVNLRKIVNGQHVSPAAAQEFAQSTPSADTLAIAPYFFHTIDAGSTQAENLKNLFKGDGGLMKQLAGQLRPLQKKLAIYEINLDTNKGTAAAAEREPYTAGLVAGSALAKRLLEGMLLGIQPEIVFSLAQFDSDAANGKVKLWGVTRDLGVTNRIRPQGLAMIMLNAVIGGSLYTSASEDPSAITFAAFKQKDQWKAAFVNASAMAQEISLRFPDGRLPSSLWELHAQSPLDTNEKQEKVTIKKTPLKGNDHTVTFSIPPFGLVTLNAENDSL